MPSLLVALLCAVTAYKPPSLGAKGQVMISGASATLVQKSFGDPTMWDFDFRPAVGLFLTNHLVVGGAITTQYRSAMASALTTFTAAAFVGYHQRFGAQRWSLLPTFSLGGGFTHVSSQMGGGVPGKVFLFGVDLDVLVPLARHLQAVVSPYLFGLAQGPGTTGEYGVRVGFLAWM